MKRRLIATISLSLGLSLGGVHGGVLAQQAAPPVISGNVIGDCGAGANAGGSTITCGDLNRAPGMTVITPAGVEKGPLPMEVAPAPEPAPDAEPVLADDPAPVDEPAAETTVDAVEPDTTAEPDTAVASETDLDADNYPDALEVEVGLDPNNVDTDADGVADGDEGNLYGTDPFILDTDGDGVSDGGELFDRRTDPLVWNDFAVDGTAAAPEEVAADEVPAVAAAPLGDSAALAQEVTEDLTATNGNAAARGNGNASSAPGTVTRNGVSGLSLLGPDGTYKVTESSPPIINVSGETTDVSVVPAPGIEAAPAAVAESTETTETAEPVTTETTDTDGDGVTDDDEVTTYGTDPGTWDSDGDDLSDGDELFSAGTDPLVWDTNGDGIADGGVETAVDADALAAESDAPMDAADAAASTTSVDSDADRLADVDEATVGTDPASPDSDGDGYYDGDEVNLNTAPLDPAIFPTT